MIERSQPAISEGSRVLILKGKHSGSEGVCLGQIGDGNEWAISPDGSSEILNLRFKDGFSLLIDLSANPARN